MRFVLLAFKNIGVFIKHHTVMFFFLVFVQIICMVVIFITCGMAYNMNFSQEKQETIIDEGKEFSFVFEEDEEFSVLYNTGTNEKFIYDKDGNPTDISTHSKAVPVGEFRELIKKFLSRIKEYKLKSTQLYVYSGQVIKKGSDADMFYDLTTYLPDSYFPGLNYDDYALSDMVKEYISSDEKVIFGWVDMEDGPSIVSPLVIGETYELYGKKYKCIGSSGWNFIPFNAMPDEFVVYNINLFFDKVLYKDDIEKIDQAASDVFGSRIEYRELPEPYDPVEFQFTQMLFVISILMMLIVLLAIAKFYHFILGERIRTLAVLRLCGCTRRKVHIVYMVEILVTMIVTSALGYLVFKFFVYDWLAKYYNSFQFFYITPVYLVIMVSYFIIALVIMSLSIIPSTKLNIRDMENKL